MFRGGWEHICNRAVEERVNDDSLMSYLAEVMGDAFIMKDSKRHDSGCEIVIPV